MRAAVLTFESFRLDLTNEILWRGTDRISIRPKTLAVLQYFAQHPQRLITKDELLEHVWPDVTVDDELLRGYIRDLRQLLGDTPVSPRLIETVPKRGYRFLPEVVSEVSEVESRSAQNPAPRGAVWPASRSGSGSFTR
jgi:DNA-binding winged helix-turn-helix (wHTH) protein